MRKKIGRYEICAKPGAGGMGEVYLAGDSAFDSMRNDDEFRKLLVELH